jgi:hypothetical protein
MFRKMTFVIPVLFISITINAQFQKGDKIVGASVGSAFFNNESRDLSTSISNSALSNDNFGITLNPLIGWFINDNVAIGIMPAIGYNKQKQLGKTSSGSTYLKDESNQYNFSIGGLARYYFKGNSTTLRFFGQYDLSLGISGSKSEGFEYEKLGVYVDRYNQKSSGDFLAKTGLAFGVSKFITHHTSLDFYIGYKFTYIKSNPTGTSAREYSDPGTPDETQSIDYDQKLTGNNLVLGVGFQIFLEKKK